MYGDCAPEDRIENCQSHCKALFMSNAASLAQRCVHQVTSSSDQIRISFICPENGEISSSQHTKDNNIVINNNNSEKINNVIKR